MTNNLRFIGVNTLKNISDAIREKVGRKTPIAPGKWEETLMPFDYDAQSESFDANYFYYQRAINATENFNGNKSLMMISGSNFYSDFDTRSTMYNMFNDCTNLFGSPACGRNVINMRDTYHNCYNLTGSPACGPKVVNMDNTYHNCYNLTGSPACGPNVTSMRDTYHNCHNLTGSPVCGPNVTRMRDTYHNCYNLTGSPICGPKVTDIADSYDNCRNLTGSPVCGPNVTNMSYTYYNCHNLTGSPVCGPNVTSMWNTYYNCHNLTGSPVCGPNVTNMIYTYYNCFNLYKTGYLDCTNTCDFTNTFRGAFNNSTPFELVIGANVNFNNINVSTFGATRGVINQESGPNGVTIAIHTAYPENGVRYIKRVKGDRIGSYGLINIYRENNIS